MRENNNFKLFFQRKKKKFFFIFLIFIISFVVSWSFLKIEKNSDQKVEVFKCNQSCQKSEGLNISDWKTYRNKKYNFEVRYPKNWDVYEDDSEKLPFPENIKHRILLFLSHFIIINPDFPQQTVEASSVFFVVSCEADQYGACPNIVSITAHKPVGMFGCSIGEKEDNLSLDISPVFSRISKCSKNNGQAQWYYFANGDSYYSFRVEDSTSEKQFMEVENAILQSFRLIEIRK